MYLQKIYYEDVFLAYDSGSELRAAILEKEERQKKLVGTLTDLEQQEREAKLLGLEIDQLGPEVNNRDKLHEQNQGVLKLLNLLQRIGKRLLRSEISYDIDRIGISQR